MTSLRVTGTARRMAGAAAAAMLAAGAALALPGVSYAADGPAPATSPAPATPAGPATQIPGDGCRGVTLAVLPAAGGITDGAGTEGGHLWTRDTPSGTCVGTVVEDVAYGGAGTQTWRVAVFDAANPGGLTVAEQPFSAAGPGVYTASFRVHAEFTGLTQVCVTATSPRGPAAGLSCVTAGPAPAPQQFTQHGDAAPALPSSW